MILLLLFVVPIVTFTILLFVYYALFKKNAGPQDDPGCLAVFVILGITIATTVLFLKYYGSHSKEAVRNREFQEQYSATLSAVDSLVIGSMYSTEEYWRRLGENTRGIIVMTTSRKGWVVDEYHLMKISEPHRAKPDTLPSIVIVRRVESARIVTWQTKDRYGYRNGFRYQVDIYDLRQRKHEKRLETEPSTGGPGSADTVMEEAVRIAEELLRTGKE